LYIQEEARNTITKMLDELQFGRTEPIVRVNSVESGLAQDDIKTVMQANSLPPTWMIPKVDDPLDIQWVSFLPSVIVLHVKDLLLNGSVLQ